MAVEILSIYGFSIKENTLYEVREKMDSSAPDAYKKEGTSKMLVNRIRNIESGAVYNDYLKAWDTALYQDSSLLSKAFPDVDVRASVLDKLKKYVVEPLERVQGTNTLRHTSDNNDFWDHFRVEVYRGKVFNTAEPKELLELTLLLLKKKLTPSDMISHPEFKASQYCIVDKEKVQNKKAETTEKTYEAIGKFESFLANDRANLISILNWINIPVNEQTENSSLRMVFNNFLEDKNDSFQNTDIFLDAVKMFGTATGKNKIYIHNKLKEASLKGKVKTSGKDIYIAENFIGSSFKAATEAIIADKTKELKKLFNQAIEE